MKSFPTRCYGWSARAAAFFHADEPVRAAEVAVEVGHKVLEQWVVERLAHVAVAAVMAHNSSDRDSQC